MEHIARQRADRNLPPLDILPSYRQCVVLERLGTGDQLAVFPDGECRFRRTHERVARTTFDALVRRQWITLPGFPRFDGLASGTITERGRAALER